LGCRDIIENDQCDGIDKNIITEGCLWIDGAEGVAGECKEKVLLSNGFIYIIFII
jgi:hypothetical protein